MVSEEETLEEEGKKQLVVQISLKYMSGRKSNSDLFGINK
jgi:hypothetical protein